MSRPPIITRIETFCGYVAQGRKCEAEEELYNICLQEQEEKGEISETTAKIVGIFLYHYEKLKVVVTRQTLPQSLL